MSYLVTEIRVALAKATLGPWEAHDITEIDPDGVFDLAHVVADDPDDPHGDRVAVAASILRADAHLIANAPAWLAALCDRLEAAEAEIERLRRLVEAEDMHAALAQGETCDVCAHLEAENLAEQVMAEMDRADAAEARADAAEAKLAACEGGRDVERTIIYNAVSILASMRELAEEAPEVDSALADWCAEMRRAES